MSTLETSTPIPTEQVASPRVPVPGEGFQDTPRTSGSKAKDSKDAEDELSSEGAKAGNRRLFGFGKEKDDTGTEKSGEATPLASETDLPLAQPIAQRPRVPSSPPQSTHPYNVTSSPQRNLYSAPPRVVSPAGSQIFERDVQESADLPMPNSPAIPSHIQTENHIPPVLDASSAAITNSNLNPDAVEIVMHSSHQPAAVSVTGIGSGEPAGTTWGEDLIAHPDRDDAASNYGAIDSADVRRLSFISFQDIVQSEHAEHTSTGGRDSIYVAGLSSLSSTTNRSPSPIRSPVSSQGLGTSPPTSNSASVKGVELSPKGRPLGSPVPSTHTQSGGELTIETMGQALRRTGSRDLSGLRSQPIV